MIKVISFKICPFVQRVTAMLEAKLAHYEVEYIRLSDKPRWFLDLSPTGQVPVLVTDTGTALFESDAIVEYLDETGPPLETGLEPEKRARNRAWSYQASKNYLVQCSAMQSRDMATFKERMQKLDAAFGRIEAALGEGPFFAGAAPGNVDIAWLPLLHRASLVTGHTGHDMLRDYPKVKAWQESLLGTGLADRSVPGDFNELFAGFYLSDQTWLGRGAASEETAVRTMAVSDKSCCG